MIKCDNCGVIQNDSNKVCMYCNKPLINPISITPIKETYPLPYSLTALFLSIFIPLAGFVVSLVSLSIYKKDKDTYTKSLSVSALILSIINMILYVIGILLIIKFALKLID